MIFWQGLKNADAICSMPRYRKFVPKDVESSGTELLSLDEYEVFRLLNLEKKTQSECAERMQISRSTVSRIYDNAGEKIARCPGLGQKNCYRRRRCNGL